MKYEITKEQIELLSVTSHGDTKLKLKEWFPEAFKTVLEVGKWYKTEDGWLFCYQKKDNCYGFNPIGWHPIKSWSWNDINVKLATKEDVFEALKKEAVKRYKDGGFVHSFVHNKPLKINNSGIECEFIYKYNKLHFGSHGNKCIVVFQNGKWAEIIPTITKEEAEKQLGKKIID